MIGWLVNKKIDAYQRAFDYDMDYFRDIYAASPRAFRRFSRFLGMAEYHEGVPLEALYAVKLVATLAEDCGPCTQLVVTMAERARVNSATLRAIVAGDESAMPADAALGFRFARAVLARDIGKGDLLREEVVSRWGRKALVSLAFAIASSRVFPAVKYALGHGKACVRVRVAGADAPLHREESVR
ncbi:MAG: hypothetical protein WCA98_03755 [Candidatus Acidiferrales bacterium]